MFLLHKVGESCMYLRQRERERERGAGSESHHGRSVRGGEKQREKGKGHRKHRAIERTGGKQAAVRWQQQPWKRKHISVSCLRAGEEPCSGRIWPTGCSLIPLS